ncbi:MAG TPA: hypothetical protein VJT33_02915 [bacterium]|nr:hypothetical protein [bacterium]
MSEVDLVVPDAVRQRGGNLLDEIRLAGPRGRPDQVVLTFAAWRLEPGEDFLPGILEGVADRFIVPGVCADDAVAREVDLVEDGDERLRVLGSRAGPHARTFGGRR